MTASVATDGISPALAATFRDDAAAAVEWVANYLETVAELPVLAQVAPGDLVRSLPGSAPLEAEPFEDVLRDLDRFVIPATTHWNHPRFFAYFPHTGSEPGILAELLIAALNVNGLLWRTSPAATELEEVSLRWLAQLLGLPEAWFGQIQESASLSTLGALAAAREAGGGRRLVLCSEEAHSSVEKATRLLELDLRKLPVDGAFRMRPDVLAHELRRRDVAAVVATVGTTSTTAVDPLEEIGLLCERAGAWLHVDGAYAAAAGVCPEFRWALAGVERADSFVVNAHKWLCMPAECSCLYTARPEAFRSAFSVVPEYLRTDDDGATNLRNYGSLFLGAHSTVAYGDKAVGTNHVLPTARAARYTGGLWVGKFLKTLTYQRLSEEGTRRIAPPTAAISTAELFGGHALTATMRLERTCGPPAGAERGRSA